MTRHDGPLIPLDTKGSPLRRKGCRYGLDLVHGGLSGDCSAGLGFRTTANCDFICIPLALIQSCRLDIHARWLTSAAFYRQLQLVQTMADKFLD